MGVAEEFRRLGVEELRRRHFEPPGVNTEREFRCPECGNRCTRGPDGEEYGHRKNAGRGDGGEGKCSRWSAAHATQRDWFDGDSRFVGADGQMGAD